MLDIALEFLRDELRDYIIARTGTPIPTEVALTKVMDDLGKPVVPVDGIGLTLINIEEERSMKEQLPKYTYIEDQQVKLEPELRLNLHLLITTNFQQYNEGLKYLSHVITFFQSHSAFNGTRYPALDPRIEKLMVDILSLNYEQLNEIWAFTGGKQLPSVVYRVRMLALQDVEPAGAQPPILIIAPTIESLT